MGFLASDTGKSLDAVLGDIKKGRVASCYLIYGDEEYLAKDALDKIINLVLAGESRDLNLFHMDGQNEDVDRICESILTPPLIPGGKVVVVKNLRFFRSKPSPSNLTGKVVENSGDNSFEDVGQSREDAKALVDALTGGLPEGNCLILTADSSIDKRKKLFKTISDIGIVLGFSRVKGEKRQKNLLRDTAKEFLDEKGKKLTAEAFLALERKTGFNLREFRGALEKLITYIGDRSLVEKEDVEDVIGRTKEDSIFDLTSALTEKNAEKALLTLKDLLDQGVHHLRILTMITREIRLLLHTKIFMKSGRLVSFSPEMDYNRFQNIVYPDIREWISQTDKKDGGLAGQHPYVIYNALKNSGRFSYEELVEHFGALVDADLAFKTTGKNPRLLLERLLIDICM
ncbi:MAG: DNA polymerase III subunit delta [Proteobacteria bacterium]|nr:DNA polymerase III subunit delta [Pseudomonadota bacterium]